MPIRLRFLTIEFTRVVSSLHMSVSYVWAWEFHVTARTLERLLFRVYVVPWVSIGIRARAELVTHGFCGAATSVHSARRSGRKHRTVNLSGQACHKLVHLFLGSPLCPSADRFAR